MQRAWIAAAFVPLLSLACSEPSGGNAVAPAPGPAARALVAARRAPVQARSFRFTSSRAPKIAAGEAPVSLTASDGTGLALVSLRADAVADAPLAFTQVHMTFENPEDRVIEGQFRITLPTGATVSRFAMKIDERWQEGEVVELQAARRAYEEFLHRRQDPALLEQSPGNEFSARVFPIPARGRKEIVLSYSQELVSAGEPYRFPLRGLPSLGELSIRVSAGGAVVAEDNRREVVPVEDFTVPAARLGGGGALHAGDLAVARVTPSIEDSPDEIDSLLVLVDTSASRALGFEDQARTVDNLMRGLGDGAGDRPVLVAAFDQEVEVIHKGGARGYPAAAAKLLARKPLGASDLGAALRWAADARHDGAPYRRVVLVSDGVATAGDLDAEPLRAAVKGLAAAGVERLDAVAVGGIRDQDRLAALVTAGLPRDGAVIDGSGEPEAIADRLTRRSRSGIVVAVEGADWWWPRRLDAVQAGDQALIYARIPEGRSVRVLLDGAPVEVPASSARVERPLLERAVARAEIASLVAERDALSPTTERARREELKDRITAVSTAKRVLSPFTALLVLETADDYARFGIDRKALADILTVQDGGLALVHRGERSLVIARPVPDRPKIATKEEPAKGKADGDVADDEGEGADPSARGAPADKSVADGVLEGRRVDSVDEKKKPEERADLDANEQGAAPVTPPAEAAPSVAGAGNAGPTGSRTEADRATPATTTPAPDPAPTPEPARQPLARPPTRDSMPDQVAGQSEETDVARVDPYTGRFRGVMRLLRRKKLDDAAAAATAWRAEAPGDVMALVALGETLEAKGDLRRAARAYGSLIDLFPQRADLRRFAGERLDRIADPAALALAADTYARAAEQRADHPSSHRLLAMALLKQGKHEQAFAALEHGLAQEYPDGRFAGVRQILAEDMGLVAAAWIRAEPARRAEIRARLRKAGGTSENQPSIRFVLHWETDANDVDFHIHDGAGNHAFYSQPELASGGRLYADVTTGYGPECFTIRGPRKGRAYPYRLEAHYYSRGPMGYGMGKLEIIEHDGNGVLRFEERPFQIMQDNAFVDLGKVRR
ncbi:MAG TPA: VIT domain-containing protein [Kofleriaceae bacterium]|nr:VIT domain-containing protein [Kofleriaceae bacterium]